MEQIPVKKAYQILKKRYGPVECPLNFTHDYELCIAVILSAQCTDERVNQVTPELFAHFPSLEAFARADLPDLEQAIYSTGFYKNKAKSIRGFARSLLENYDRQLPTELKELQKLPGVGRKTANVIQSELMGKAEGITVDTHVARITRLWGLTVSKNPNIVEKDLMKVVPSTYWRDFSLLVIFLGREFCVARRPKCAECPLQKICPAAPAPS